MALDADTTLAPDAIERMSKAFEDPEVAAACGIGRPAPHSARVWERGRYVEYMFAFSFYKRIQDGYGKPLISSGCFSLYRTEQAAGGRGWSDRTLAEDMDLTWTIYQRGSKVRFLPDAVCYPIEPHNFDLMRKQLRRWSHGFIQNVQLHWQGVLALGYLRSMVSLALWDSIIASIGYLFAIPLLAILVNAGIPVCLRARRAGDPHPGAALRASATELGKALRELSRPTSHSASRTRSMMLKAAFLELVLRRPFRVYEKGH